MHAYGNLGSMQLIHCYASNTNGQSSGQLRTGCGWTGALYRGMAAPFRGQIPSPGSWGMHKIKNSASAGMGVKKWGCTEHQKSIQ